LYCSLCAAQRVALANNSIKEGLCKGKMKVND